MLPIGLRGGRPRAGRTELLGHNLGGTANLRRGLDCDTIDESGLPVQTSFFCAWTTLGFLIMLG
ncbi:hypothetical protein CU048_03300 [Beijerinckiaceae bacterium]|nr:hypothetical protein CU048_03300 [Beijerinckiaceae bacterium]